MFISSLRVYRRSCYFLVFRFYQLNYVNCTTIQKSYLLLLILIYKFATSNNPTQNYLIIADIIRRLLQG